MACISSVHKTRCALEPGRKAPADSRELGHAFPEAHLSALGANLLGYGGMVVLQDEPLDVVSPASFLLHGLGLGRPKGKELG